MAARGRSRPCSPFYRKSYVASTIEWKERLDAAENEIRQGKQAQARAQLEKLYQAKVPIRFQVRFSELARRCEVPTLGLRLLFPAVRADARVATGTAEQKTEYAACLTRIGAVEEAIFTLTPLASECPAANLYLAFAHINRWEYEQAVSYLERYLTTPDLAEYAKAVGRFNLAASLTALDRSQESLHLLEPLIADAAEKKLTLLQSACLELRAQNYIAEEKWNEASQTLQQAALLLGGADSREAFFIRKWQGFVHWLKTPVSAASHAELEKIREEARRRAHWETIRQTDYYELRKTREPALLAKLYYGTRFASFREKLLALAGGENILSPFEFPEHHEATQVVELVTAQVVGKPEQFLNPTKLPYKLFQVLTSDWYRPFRLPTLFGMVYPKEFFHPTSSKLRVHFHIQQLRLALKRHRVRLTVEQTREEYQIKITDGVRLRVEHGALERGLSPQWERLFVAFGTRDFQTREARKVLKCSERTAQRLLGEGCRLGICVAKGAGPARVYQLAMTGLKKLAA